MDSISLFTPSGVPEKVTSTVLTSVPQSCKLMMKDFSGP
ncbi:hypothetical protein Sd1012_1575 [Shigella dysenteriae 1012]|nr:hypothetical protein Sd1012_1575 [Shigella dysenteriae 1012]